MTHEHDQHGRNNQDNHRPIPRHSLTKPHRVEPSHNYCRRAKRERKHQQLDGAINVVVRQRPEKHVRLRAFPRPRYGEKRRRGRPGRSENLEERDEVKVRRLDDLSQTSSTDRAFRSPVPNQSGPRSQSPHVQITLRDAQGWQRLHR